MDTDQVWRRGDAYPADWPEWLRSADIEWCRVEIAEGGKVVWHDGIWRNGHWRGGEWRDGAWFDGCWYSGDWLDGVWRNGIWHRGEWHGGRWLAGGWYDGVWHDGERHNGVWHDGIWHDGVWYGGRWRYGVWHGGVWLDDGAWRTDGPPSDSNQPEKHMSNTETDVMEYPHHDMDLRDRLAAHVIQGLLANPSGPIQARADCGWGWCNCTIEQVADIAWLIADHMLKARGGSNAD